MGNLNANYKEILRLLRDIGETFLKEKGCRLVVEVPDWNIEKAKCWC